MSQGHIPPNPFPPPPLGCKKLIGEEAIREKVMPALGLIPCDDKPANSCYECEHAVNISGYQSPFETWCEAPAILSHCYGDEPFEPCFSMRNLKNGCGLCGHWFVARAASKQMRQAYSNWHPGHDTSCQSEQGGDSEQDLQE